MYRSRTLWYTVGMTHWDETSRDGKEVYRFDEEIDRELLENFVEKREIVEAA